MIKSKYLKNKLIFEYGMLIAVSILLIFLVNKFLIFKVKIPSESMIPTLNVNDTILTTKIYTDNSLDRGNIIVFYSEEYGELMIKRLIGLPGDKIIIDKGIVKINGEVLKENYIGAGDELSGEYFVPEGKYFFLGDNRLVSSDSRYWTNPYIDFDNIKGLAFFRIFPFNNIGLLN